MRSLQVEDDGVLLDFGGTLPPVKAKVVIGCDGYMSKVRKQWLNDGPPTFSGAGKLPAPLQCRAPACCSVVRWPCGAGFWVPIVFKVQAGRVPHR